MKNLLILGPPGAGKGTQAERLAEYLELTHLSTGAIFRANIAEGTELGQLAASYIDRGDYVPDHVTDAMVEAYIRNAPGGILLDGYPRTLEQARTLDGILERSQRTLDAAINLQVAPEESVRRMLRRAEIEHRADDTEDVIRHRIDVYHQQTEPLIAHYDALGLMHQVDGSGTVEQVFQAILTQLRIERAL